VDKQKVDNAGTAWKSNYITGKRYALTDKYQMLPAKADYTTKLTYMDKNQEILAFKVTVFRVSEDGTEKMMGMPQVKLVKRDWLNNASRTAKEVALLVPGVVAALTSITVDAVGKTLFGKDPQTTKYVDQAYDVARDMLIPERKVEATLSCGFILTEHDQLQGTISLESPYYKLEKGAIDIVF